MIERHVKMIELVAERGEIETGQLARLLNTSEVTVRNDLNTLSKKGILARRRGYATLPNPDDTNYHMALHYEASCISAAAAAQRVRDGGQSLSAPEAPVPCLPHRWPKLGECHHPDQLRLCCGEPLQGAGWTDHSAGRQLSEALPMHGGAVGQAVLARFPRKHRVCRRGRVYCCGWILRRRYGARRGAARDGPLCRSHLYAAGRFQVGKKWDGIFFLSTSSVSELITDASADSEICEGLRKTECTGDSCLISIKKKSPQGNATVCLRTFFGESNTCLFFIASFARRRIQKRCRKRHLPDA